MPRFSVVVRVCCLIGRILLLAALANWVAAAALVWVLRDGLGPGMIESAGVKAIIKFLVGWGVPAFIMVALLFGLSWVGRRCQPAQAERQIDE